VELAAVREVILPTFKHPLLWISKVSSSFQRRSSCSANPQTGKAIKIAAKTNGKFAPGKALKDLNAKPAKVAAKVPAKTAAKAPAKAASKKNNCTLNRSLFKCTVFVRRTERLRALDRYYCNNSSNRVGGGITSAVLPHHRAYGSVHGGSR